MNNIVLKTFVLLALASAAVAQTDRSDYVRYTAPEMFTYDELATLSQDAPLAPELQAKVDTITTTPFISNEAYYRGAKPHRPVAHHLGPSLRLVLWNIERGMRLDDIKLLFTDREAFIHKVAAERYEAKHDDAELTEDELALEADAGQNYALLRAQINMMETADVIALNEVDWGMPRSKYREVIRELGEALDMNWAYGVEFIEIDPKVVGTESFDNIQDPAERQQLIDHFTPDKTRIKALHGSAILSRYPIRSAKLIPFEAGYNWFTGEEHLPTPEKIMRGLAGALGDPLHREMRRGWRMSLYAELDVPALPQGKLTVVTPHLENRAKPEIRKAQLAQVLEEIRVIEHPVVVAADFNTTGTDYSPKTFTRLFKQVFVSEDLTPELGAVFLTPFGLAYSALHFGTQIAHNQGDPTVHGVPVLAPNHEHPLFQMVQEYRFDDGRAFDLRGDLERTHDGVHSGNLANSNDRADKGFTPTFETGTMGFLGQFKLDWILVKSYIDDPHASSEAYRFAPHGSWVLKLLNNAPLERLSDHHPMVVTLPFDEPELPKLARVRTRTDLPAWAAEMMRREAAEREARETPPPPPHLTLSKYTCRDHLGLADENPGPAGVRIVWALGYHYGESGLDDSWPPLTHARVAEFTERVENLCETKPQALWFDVVRGLAPETVRRPEISTPIDLDPGRYTCQQHVDLAASESHLAEVRAVFADGYVSFHQGVNESSPPITAHDIIAFEQSILDHCRANPTALWIHAVRHETVHAARDELALSWDELANATYHGIYTQPITLVDGVYESAGERRRVTLVRDFQLSGHLHGDGLDEAVVLLTESSGGTGQNIYLAVVAHHEDGPENRGTALIGDRVQIMDGRIVDGGIELDVVQAGPNDAMCCPTQKATRRWLMGSSALREMQTEITGTLSLADLEGVDWILTHFDWDEPAPNEPEVSLYVERDRVAGHGGCNRYFANISEGETPGSLTIGPVGATRMACPGGAEDVEFRFLQKLERVTQYRFIAGKLALTTDDGVMLFRRVQ